MPVLKISPPHPHSPFMFIPSPVSNDPLTSRVHKPHQLIPNTVKLNEAWMLFWRVFAEQVVCLFRILMFPPPFTLTLAPLPFMIFITPHQQTNPLYVFLFLFLFEYYQLPEINMYT